MAFDSSIEFLLNFMLQEGHKVTGFPLGSPLYSLKFTMNFRNTLQSHVNMLFLLFCWKQTSFFADGAMGQCRVKAPLTLEKLLQNSTKYKQIIVPFTFSPYILLAGLGESKHVMLSLMISLCALLLSFSSFALSQSPGPKLELSLLEKGLKGNCWNTEKEIFLIDSKPNFERNFWCLIPRRESFTDEIEMFTPNEYHDTQH